MSDTPDTPETEVPAELRSIDPEKLAEIRKKILGFKESAAKTVSGSEAPPETTDAAQPMQGKDVEWSEYDLEYSVRHLYPQAQFRMTHQGPKWVAMVDEFTSVEKSFRNYGKKTSDGAAMNLGQYLNDMLNSPEGWRVVSILPAGLSQAGVLLQRAVPVVLPDPVPLKKETEVEPPSDVELERTEDAAMKFMATEGLTPDAPVNEDVVGTSPVSLEEQVLSINPPTDSDPGPLGMQEKRDPTLLRDAGALADAALQGPDFGNPWASN